MSSDAVGGLYIAVGIDADKAIRDARLLNEQVAQIARQVTQLGKGASLAPVGQQFAHIQQQARQAGQQVQAMSRQAATSMQATQRATVQASTQVAQIGTAARGAGGGFDVASLAAGALGGAVALVGSQVAGMARSLVDYGRELAGFVLGTAADMEMLQIQLSGLLGSTEAGAKEMRFLLDLGKRSIVPTESLIQADRLMLAFGVHANGTRQQLVRFMSDFGTATGATGEQVYYLSLALGQVASAGRANRVDMLQLAHVGVNTMQVYRYLGKEIGLSAREVEARVKDGILTADRLFPALVKYGAQFQSTAKAAQASTRGLLANIADIIKTNIGTAFQDVNREVAAFLRGVADMVQRIDFSRTAQALQQLGGTVASVFGGAQAASDGFVNFMNYKLPEIIVSVGGVVAEVARQFQLWTAVAQTTAAAIRVAYELAAHAVLQVATAVYDATNALTFGVGGLVDSATLGIRSKLEQAAIAVDTAGQNALADMIAWNAKVDALWRTPSIKPVYTYVMPATQVGIMNGQIPKQALLPQSTEIANMLAGINAQASAALPAAKGAGKGGGASTALQAAKAAVAAWRDLVERAVKGRQELADAFRVPFGPKILAGGGQPITAAFKAFTSGDVSTIVDQFKAVKTAVEDLFSIAEDKATGRAAKAITAQRRRLVTDLKASTGELVRLATEADQINAKLKTVQDAYDATTAQIDKQRDELAAAYARQQTAIARQFDDYYVATSATTGRLVRGAITTAQAALDAATAAYDAAKSKLDELTAARDDFLASLHSTFSAYVNDLSAVNDEITRYTRLDAVGSFSSVTEQAASTSAFLDGLRSRLAALKAFSADVRTLMARGLDASLTQQLLTSGPDSAGALAHSLAGASADELAQINAVQADLASTIAGMQKDASAQWFDAGIAAQEAFTAPLKAAMDAAQAQVDELTRQKDLALGVLEAWNAEQTELLDAQQAAAKARYDVDTANLQAALTANADATKKIAASIDARLAKLPDSGYAAGIGTMQGLIDGLSDDAKLKELKAAAAAMAAAITDTIRAALQIHSPSRVMVAVGENVGTGLAMGMERSLSRIESASNAMAAATVPSVRGVAGAGTPVVVVHTYLGDKEITDVVDTRIEMRDADSLSYVLAGRRR